MEYSVCSFLFSENNSIIAQAKKIFKSLKKIKKTSIIGGSTTIGDTSWMGLNCTLKNKISIGSRVIVGCGAAVINDVSDEDIVAGVPAKSIKDKVSSDQLFLMAGQQ